MMYTAEARKERTKELQKFITWFETFKIAYDSNASKGIYRRERLMQRAANDMHTIKQGESLGEKYMYKFAQEFIQIANEGRKDITALMKLYYTVRTPELDIAWNHNHVELHYLTRIEKLLNEWEDKVNELAKVCNASTIEEIAAISPMWFKKHIENYMKLWQDPSEDVGFCKEASCDIHSDDLHKNIISFMWVIETIRSEGGPEVIKKLMNKYDINTEKFTEVFPDPPQFTDEEKEIAACIDAVNEAWEVLQAHKYSGKYQRAYAAALAKFDELIQ